MNSITAGDEVNAVKTVVIGAGRMGRRHMEVIRAAGLTLVGIADRDPAALASAGDKYGVPPASQYLDAATMLRAARAECVVVATTAPTHCEFTCVAAESDAKFILCEKPLAVSLDECDRMIDTCRRTGARLAVNHQMRFMEQYAQTKRIVESDAFGGLGSATVVAGNFGMAMNGTHYFEMFRYLTGEPAAEVSAWFDEELVPNPRGPQFQDRSGSVRVTTKAGRRLYLDASADQGHGLRALYAGQFGQLFVDELAGRAELVVRNPEHRELPTTRYGMPYEESAITIQPADAVAPTRSVLESLLAGGDFPTGEDGRLAVATLVAAYVSNESGHRAVRLDENLPGTRVFPWA